MQDRNEQLEILQSKVGALDDLLKEPMPPEAVTRTISKLPHRKEVVKLRGLDFVVRYVSNKTGVLLLELRDAQQRTGADGAGADESPKELSTEDE